jgi:hypothetical protein
MIVFILKLFLAFQPHFNGDVLFELFPLVIPIVTLVKCKEWTRNMMAMRGIRLK